LTTPLTAKLDIENKNKEIIALSFQLANALKEKNKGKIF